MSALAAHKPTRIRRLYVRGYRSIRELELTDLPPIVVLHGENGAGKSNILRAMALPMRWLGSDMEIAGTREESTRIDYVIADAQLGIRRDDFNRLARHEMQFRMEIELGSRAQQSVGGLAEGACLDVDIVVQDVGDGIRWWAPRARIGDGLSLTGNEAQPGALNRQGVEHQRAEVAAKHALILDRLRSRLLRRELLRVSDAYRRISRERIVGSEFDVDIGSLVSPEQIQRRLYLMATSSDTRERAVPRHVATRLAQAIGGSSPIELIAVRNNEFREYETQITRGDVDGIPLTSLGTGEQQLLILLLDVLVSSTPIVQIEEPEAHLHKKLMLRLADLLARVVAEHDLDQLFIATHHHAFAIASEYYDVTCDDVHGTRAILTNRAKAIEHFYEPGPLWDALRSLVGSGLTDNAVLFRDESGAPVRAREVLASIREEGPLAKKFAEEMTKTILLSMREEAESEES